MQKQRERERERHRSTRTQFIFNTFNWTCNFFRPSPHQPAPKGDAWHAFLIIINKAVVQSNLGVRWVSEKGKLGNVSWNCEQDDGMIWLLSYTFGLITTRNSNISSAAASVEILQVTDSICDFATLQFKVRVIHLYHSSPFLVTHPPNYPRYQELWLMVFKCWCRMKNGEFHHEIMSLK